jgi:homoserine dehydrogenase
MKHRLVLIGFGTVGQGLAEILLKRELELEAVSGVRFVVVAVSDLLKGSVYHPDGLDLAELLDLARTGQRLDAYADRSGVVKGWDSLSTIVAAQADTVVEVSWTDVQTGQPAIAHVKAAFASGKHAVLTNKGPIALAYHELQQAADAAGCLLRFEGTVMSGTPAIRLGRQALAGCQISEIKGILNGTTNYILTNMEAGVDYAAALAEAQRLGYAEADPTADVEGFDAMAKVVILANVMMGAHVSLGTVVRQGITGLNRADIAAATEAGERWKLIGHIKRQPDGGVSVSVQPMRLPIQHPLAGVSGVTNAITFTTDLLGDVTLVGPGAGRYETGFAVLSDLLEIAHVGKP